jgi:endonuclease/exonuclease/phosphatase family metal-dependent hydrolase
MRQSASSETTATMADNNSIDYQRDSLVDYRPATSTTCRVQRQNSLGCGIVKKSNSYKMSNNHTPNEYVMGRSRSRRPQLTTTRRTFNTVFLHRNLLLLFGILFIFTTPFSSSVGCLVHGFGGVSSSSSPVPNAKTKNIPPHHHPHAPHHFRLISWNLLAPPYCVPAKYPWCDPRHLEWDYRKALIVQQLTYSQADILCLQEVQVDLFSDLLASLQLHGNYTGVLQNVTGEHQVGCAIVIRNKNNYSSSSPFVAPVLEVVRVESRSRALLAVLKQQPPPPTVSSSSPEKRYSATTKEKEENVPPPPPSFLYLCNVHLEAGMTYEDELVRYHQLKSLFKRLKYQCQQDGISSIIDDGTTEEDVPPIVLAGDFNMMYHNPLYSSLSQGWLEQPIKKKGRDNNGKITRVTSTSTTTATSTTTTSANIRTNNNKVQKRSSVQFPTAITKLRDAYLCGMPPSSSFAPALSDSRGSTTTTSTNETNCSGDLAVVTTTTTTISPPNDLESQRPVLLPPQRTGHNNKLAMTYSFGTILDYIWASEAVTIHDTLIFHPHSVMNQRQKWPSYDHPSDHVPIGIDLEWGGTVRRRPAKLGRTTI